MVVINPSECIDCGVCEPECPAHAIVSDGDPGRGEVVEHQRDVFSEMAVGDCQAKRVSGGWSVQRYIGQICSLFFAGTVEG